jgi:hypothetical protein
MANYKLHSSLSEGPLEIENNNSHALISYRSIVAGLLIAMFTMIGLLGLGLAFGGIGMDEDTTAKSAGIFTGIWFLVSTLVSLFVGSYFAARVSKFRTGRIGSAQGLVIASLFLGFFLYQTVSTIGSAGSAVGSFIGKSGSMVARGAQQASQNPAISNAVSNITEDSLGGLQLKSDPTTVAEGLGTRLFRGDSEGAKNYLAAQAGITPTEADARVAQMKARVDKFVSDTKEATGTALKSAGWSLFLLVVLGSIASLGGGALGSVANFRKPLIREREDYYPPGEHA